MDGPCIAHGRDEKCIQNVGRKTRKDEDTWKAQALMRGEY
jgi:hypothetical protein